MIVLTDTEFVQKLRNIAERKTSYKNSPPYNLCYYDGESLSSDCWNLIKSLIWDPTIDQNYTKGHFAMPDYSTGLGDWTAAQIIAHCEVVSEDFSDISKIPVGAFLYYYNGTHAGTYVGDGKVIESTAAWQHCTLYSDILSVEVNGCIVGQRSKNGSIKGYWSKWAKLPWIRYTDEAVEKPVENEEPESQESDAVTEQPEAEVCDACMINLDDSEKTEMSSADAETAEPNAAPVAEETGTATGNTGAATEETGAATEETGAATEETGAVTEETGAATEETGTVTEDTGTVTEKPKKNTKLEKSKIKKLKSFFYDLLAAALAYFLKFLKRFKKN